MNILTILITVQSHQLKPNFHTTCLLHINASYISYVPPLSSFPTKLSHQHCKLADVALSSLEPRCCRSPAPISLPQMF